MSKYSKRIIAAAVAAIMVGASFAGCTPKENSGTDASGSGTDGKAGKVYFLNFKPEQDEACLLYTSRCV